MDSEKPEARSRDAAKSARDAAHRRARGVRRHRGLGPGTGCAIARGRDRSKHGVRGAAGARGRE